MHGLCTVWLYLVIKPISVRSGKCTTLMVISETQRNSGEFFTLISEITWIEYRALTKTGLPADIDGPCDF